MKILMVNKFLYPNGGSETYMMNLGEYLASIGHQVEYFGMEHPDRCVSNSIGAYTKTMDFHNSSALKMVQMAAKTVYSAEAREKLLKVMEDFNPDVVHLNNFNFQLTPSVIYAVNDYDKHHGTHTKLVYTAHDYQLVCPNHMMNIPSNMQNCEACISGKFINCTRNRCIHSSLMKSAIGSLEAYIYSRKKVYDRLDRIICCSEFIKSKLDCSPILKSKTVAMQNFVAPVDDAEPRAGDYVLYFGRYAFEKGIDTILGAKGVSFVCAGSGPLEDAINSADNIDNVGFKTGAELQELIQNASCCVYPSTWYENCPLSVMESIMNGTPVVASKIGGIPELIDDGKTGLLVEPNNSKMLEEAVNSILLDREKALEMSKACLEKQFDTVEKYTEKYLKLLEEI